MQWSQVIERERKVVLWSENSTNKQQFSSTSVGSWRFSSKVSKAWLGIQKKQNWVGRVKPREKKIERWVRDQVQKKQIAGIRP